MRKNGFTLIELLAVIVILAIIALIATPIILGIINDVREKANERSVELYASAVRNGIAAYQLTHSNAPKSFSDLTVQYDGDVKCSVQELYEDGSFYLEGCKVNNGEKEYSYGTKQGTGVEVGKMSICNPLEVQTAGSYTAGDKYECDVDPEKQGYDYIFYVLNSTSTEVNLIMDSNITSTGLAIKDANPTDTGLVAWISEDDYGILYPFDEEICWSENGCVLNDKGPITAMEYLQDATEDWGNVNPQTISTFNDDAGETHNMATTITANARLPYYSEISDYSESTAYLYNYLDDATYQTNAVSGVYGYWTLSSYASDSSRAWYVSSSGYAGDDIVYSDGYSGVRLVINLSI